MLISQKMKIVSNAKIRGTPKLPNTNKNKTITPIIAK